MRTTTTTTAATATTRTRARKSKMSKIGMADLMVEIGLTEAKTPPKGPREHQNEPNAAPEPSHVHFRQQEASKRGPREFQD